MSLPTPEQTPPRRQWSWMIAGGLAALALLLYKVNRDDLRSDKDGDAGTGRKNSSSERHEKGAGETADPAELQRVAEKVHLRYLDTDEQNPSERLSRAIEGVARSSRVPAAEIRAALDRYAAGIAAEPGRSIRYERGLAALVRGDFDEATRLFAVGPEPDVPGGPTPAAPGEPFDLLTGYLAAADAHLAAGRYEDAVRSCQDARRFLNRERDPEKWARVQAALFHVEFTRDRLDEAHALAREVLEVRERCLPPTSPGVANALHNLGVCLARRNKPAEAAELYERALRIYAEAYGPGDLAVADTASELADVLSEIDRLPEAEEAARRAVAIYASADASAPGQSPRPRLALALDRLGNILLSLQRPADAERPLTEAVSIYDRLASARPKDHAGAQHRLGLAIARAGRRKEALAHLQRSTVLAAKFFSDDDPLYAAYYHNLAVWSDAAGDDPGAVEAYTRALAILGRHRARTGRSPAQMVQTESFYAEYLRRAGVAEEDIVRRLREARGD